jgi:hypothetical protein
MTEEEDLLDRRTPLGEEVEPAASGKAILQVLVMVETAAYLYILPYLEHRHHMQVEEVELYIPAAEQAA